MVERDEKGRFVKGVSGNPGGRPIDQSKYLKRIDTAMTLKRWRAIVLKAIEQAERGDAKARQWLSDYILGKPIQYIDQNTNQSGEVTIRIIEVEQDVDDND